MGLMKFKNNWGTPANGQGVDQLRSDLFQVSIDTKSIAALNRIRWDEQIQFAVSKFPFPAREREAVPIKYFNQTNFQIGAETASSPVTLTVRHGFNVDTAKLLEDWHWLCSNPNGASALTTDVKANGRFSWMVARANATARTEWSNPNADPGDIYVPAATYRLEGVWVKGLKPTDADMEQGNGLVNLELSIQIDRYYPEKTSDLNIPR